MSLNDAREAAENRFACGLIATCSLCIRCMKYFALAWSVFALAKAGSGSPQEQGPMIGSVVLLRMPRPVYHSAGQTTFMMDMHAP